MTKKHEEVGDREILARSGRVKVDEDHKTLHLSKNAFAGIRTWGRIDFLTNHQGWRQVRA